MYYMCTHSYCSCVIFFIIRSGNLCPFPHHILNYNSSYWSNTPLQISSNSTDALNSGGMLPGSVTCSLISLVHFTNNISYRHVSSTSLIIFSSITNICNFCKVACLFLRVSSSNHTTIRYTFISDFRQYFWYNTFTTHIVNTVIIEALYSWNDSCFKI